MKWDAGMETVARGGGVAFSVGRTGGLVAGVCWWACTGRCVRLALPFWGLGEGGRGCVVGRARISSINCVCVRGDGISGCVF